MNEDLLHFIWKYQLFSNYLLFNSTEGNIEIINQGKHNFNAGPDFLEAKIRKGKTTWVGNIEIHNKSSDWYNHKHHQDKAYNNVILQVVKHHDKDIFTHDGRNIPVMEIAVSGSMEKKYKEFTESKRWIPCQNDFGLIDDFKLKMWLSNVLVERLNKKSDYITDLLKLNKNSWEETFYQLLARSFGFKINAEPFEWLAKSVQLKVLAKHQNDLTQLEAILFGQAGFLEGIDAFGDYYGLLKEEYGFLKKKFRLEPIEKHLWKFLRLRPGNFPHIRIAQFAALIHQSKSLFSKIVNTKELNEIKKLFKVQASSFWDMHYTFEKTSKAKTKIMGKSSIDVILVNTVIPILFVYGKEQGNEEIKERAIHYLEELKPEKNKIIDKWVQLGVKVSSSFYSQALIEQKNAYCDTVKCLNCGIGIEILKNQI